MAAVIQMGVGEEDRVDARGVEAEGLGVLLLELASALVEPAVDQHAAPGALDEMAGAGDAAIGAVERKLQAIVLVQVTGNSGSRRCCGCAGPGTFGSVSEGVALRLLIACLLAYAASLAASSDCDSAAPPEERF